MGSMCHSVVNETGFVPQVLRIEDFWGVRRVLSESDTCLVPQDLRIEVFRGVRRVLSA